MSTVSVVYLPWPASSICAEAAFSGVGQNCRCASVHVPHLCTFLGVDESTLMESDDADIARCVRRPNFYCNYDGGYDVVPMVVDYHAKALRDIVFREAVWRGVQRIHVYCDYTACI